MWKFKYEDGSSSSTVFLQDLFIHGLKVLKNSLQHNHMIVGFIYLYYLT